MPELPLVSVVIPCRNEVKHIASCVEHILANDIGRDRMEVFISDGMSTDGTREVIEALAAKHPEVMVLDNQQQFTPVAFNLGIKAGLGTFLAIVGARQLLDPNYLSTCISILENDPKLAGAGGQLHHEHQNENSRLIALAMSSSFGVGMGNFRVLEKDTEVDTISTPVYRMSLFDEVGLFDEELVRNQDDDFNFRVLKAGYKLHFTVKTSVKYYVRAAFGGLAKQYKQYGYWKVYVNKKHKTITTIRQLVPFLWLMFVVFGLGLSFLHPMIALIYVSVWVLYLVAGMLMALAQDNSPLAMPRIFFAYLILHFSYGWGYFTGIIDFLILGRKARKGNTALSR